MKLCKIEGCEKEAVRDGFTICEMHYGRKRRNGHYGLLERDIQPKEQSAGYILVYAPNHPLARPCQGKRVYEHRYVYYQAHGKGPFKCFHCGKTITWDDMHIDHLNSNIKDNRIENLVASCPACNQFRGKDKMRKTQRSKHAIEFNGKSLCQSEWAKLIGITHAGLRFRLTHGWSMERAFTEGRGKTGPR